MYHAGTQYRDNTFVTAGGRVLGITAMGDSLDQALDNAYEAVQKVRFDGAHYRTDIGRVEYSD